MNSQNIRDADRQKLIELAAKIESAKNESIAKEALGLAHYYLEKSENQAKYIKQLERVNAEQRQRLYEAKYGWSEGEDAEPEPHWIPVTERMPEEDCWTGANFQYSADVLMSVFNAEDDETIIDYGHTADGKWYSDTTDCFVPDTWKVTAWMSLPSPYKGEEVINEKT